MVLQRVSFKLCKDDACHFNKSTTTRERESQCREWLENIGQLSVRPGRSWNQPRQLVTHLRDRNSNNRPPTVTFDFLWWRNHDQAEVTSSDLRGSEPQTREHIFSLLPLRHSSDYILIYSGTPTSQGPVRTRPDLFFCQSTGQVTFVAVLPSLLVFSSFVSVPMVFSS